MSYLMTRSLKSPVDGQMCMIPFRGLTYVLGRYDERIRQGLSKRLLWPIDKVPKSDGPKASAQCSVQKRVNGTAKKIAKFQPSRKLQHNQYAIISIPSKYYQSLLSSAKFLLKKMHCEVQQGLS